MLVCDVGFLWGERGVLSLEVSRGDNCYDLWGLECGFS